MVEINRSLSRLAIGIVNFRELNARLYRWACAVKVRL
jgi:hypothetical protein